MSVTPHKQVGVKLRGGKTELKEKKPISLNAVTVGDFQSVHTEGGSQNK
jgi:hypothetical protein